MRCARERWLSRPTPLLGLLAAFLALAVAVLMTGGPASADTAFSDGFESGEFSAWSQLQTAGDGTATVQSAIVRTGAVAAQLSESSTSGSKAYVRKTFASTHDDLTASGDFQVRQQGAPGGNVPFFRFLDPASARVVTVYRQNGTSGSIGVTYGGAHYSTSKRLAMNTWGEITLHVITSGASSTVEVRLNDTLIYQTSSANLGTAGVSTVQIGNDTAAQAFTIVADTIEVQYGASSTSSAPVNAAPPTISGTPQAGQTLTAGPGTWNGTQPISYAYRWQRCDTSGTGCSAISGATSPTYAVTGADVGRTLRVAVTATNSAGSAGASSNASAVVKAGSTPSGLVALWHMEETSGTVMKDSAKSHDGALHSVQLGVPGFSGNAYGFTGSSYVSVPSASDLNPGSADITLTSRLKATSVPASTDWDLIRKGYYTSAGGEYKMEYQPSGQATCGFKGSSAYAELTAGPALNNGQWHTVQCVKTSSSIKLIVDGQSFSKTTTIGSIANTDSVPIGARPGSEYFKGSLDETSVQIG